MPTSASPRVNTLAPLALLLLLAACGAPQVQPAATVTPPTQAASTAAPLPRPPPSLTLTTAPTASATPVPTAAATATATGIPGFEGWSVFNPGAVDVAVEDGTLVLTLKRRALWFNAERGVLVYQPVTGNFRVTADVRAMKRSDPARPPGGDRSVQLGGLMARSGAAGPENYVFIVVGDDGNGLSVETKSTTNSVSEYEGPGWGSSQAELRVCRVGEIFNLYKRHAGAGEDWMLAATYQRSDLPQTLQVGANIYTDNVPDLVVRYEGLRLEPVADEAGCTN